MGVLNDSKIIIPDDIDFDHYLQKTDAGEKVRKASSFLDGVMHRLSPIQMQNTAPKMPFANCFLNFRPGEVTLWAGYNGSGKSMLQGQIISYLVEQQQKACIASFEMKPEVTLARLCRQSLRHKSPARDRVESYLKGTDNLLWLYDQQGTIDSRRMIAVVKHCAEKLGCQHIAIDSLMKCVKGEDDYNGQKDFVDELTAAARDYNTHIHLVHHLRKGENEDRMPGKMDIKGSGAVTDLVDNVLILWRNKKKERDIDAGKDVDPNMPDSVLLCEKQRNGEWEGMTRLYFNQTSQRYSDKREIL